MTKTTIVTIGKKPASALWADVFKRERLATADELRAQGFLPLGEIAEGLGMSKPGTEAWLAKRKFERREGRLNNQTGQRGFFYRPPV